MYLRVVCEIHVDALYHNYDVMSKLGIVFVALSPMIRDVMGT